jgi:hypothetical protein
VENARCRGPRAQRTTLLHGIRPADEKWIQWEPVAGIDGTLGVESTESEVAVLSPLLGSLSRPLLPSCSLTPIVDLRLSWWREN